MDARYRIEEKLATGGFGTIYRATDTVIDRQVALKILHRELANDASIVARFRREIAALAKLKSANTLTLYDVGETDDTLYFVMELLRGESLYDVFSRTGPLAWRRLATIARGVCNSLREAHACGIVHRDLKPANIFLEQHALDVDHVKVLDFGIAKILATSDLENHDLTRHGQMIGTFDYMAPEQMIGAECTSKSDIFTLGVVFYEMLTGARPFGEAAGPAQMLMALMTQSPAPLTGVPFELSRVIMQCLAREPQDRPDVDQLDAVLANLLESDDNGFDEDEPTLIVAQSPRPSHPLVAAPAPLSRTTLPMGSVAAVTCVSRRSLPPVMIAGDTLVSTPANIARGSQAAIARDIELALASTRSIAADAFGYTEAFLAQGTDVVAPPAVRFAPTPSAPIPVAKARLAAGTSPIESEQELAGRAAITPAATRSALVYVTIAACLFGLGFLGALTLLSN